MNCVDITAEEATELRGCGTMSRAVDVADPCPHADAPPIGGGRLTDALAELAEAQAQVARLRLQVCRLTSGQAIEGDLLCPHDDKAVAALADRDGALAKLAEAKRIGLEACGGAPMAWGVECDVDILTDGDTGDRCDWLVFFHLDDAIATRDAAIDRLVGDGHATDAESAEAMVRVLELVPRRAAIRTALEAL